MESDQESSSDDWVLLDSYTSSSDDDLALSSGCSSSASATDSDADDTTNPIVAAEDDDAEGVYELSDAEDDDDANSPPPSPPLPNDKPLAGLFHHTLDRSAPRYVAFDPAPSAHGAAKQLVPVPTFSALISDDAGLAALASNRGLVCLRGAASGDYYVANPLTFTAVRLPRPNLYHFANGEPAVVITFEHDNPDDAASNGRRRSFYRHYHVVVAFHVGYGIYSFESYSSRTWGWTVSTGIVDAQTVVPSSGVGALGRAFWRTTMGILCYEPVTDCADLVPAPMEVIQWPYWELGEMEGNLCATCTDDRVSDVVIVCLDFARRCGDDDGAVAWTLAGHFEGGCLRGRQNVMLLRSQGKAEVVMWDPSAEMVVAMDLEGRTTRTITFVPPGTGYYADFIPYVSTLAAVSVFGCNGLRAESRTKSTNEAGDVYNAKSTDEAAAAFKAMSI